MLQVELKALQGNYHELDELAALTKDTNRKLQTQADSLTKENNTMHEQIVTIQQEKDALKANLNLSLSNISGLTKQMNEMESNFHEFQDVITKAIVYETWLANPDAHPLTELKIKMYLSKFQTAVSKNSQHLLILLQDELMALRAHFSSVDDQEESQDLMDYKAQPGGAIEDVSKRETAANEKQTFTETASTIQGEKTPEPAAPSQLPASEPPPDLTPELQLPNLPNPGPIETYHPATATYQPTILPYSEVLLHLPTSQTIHSPTNSIFEGYEFAPVAILQTNTMAYCKILERSHGLLIGIRQSDYGN